MGLAKGHAGDAPRHETCADGAEAGEEGVGPWLGRLGGLGVDVLARPGKDVVDARLPVIHVGVAERARLLGAGSLCGSSHDVFVLWKWERGYR